MGGPIPIARFVGRAVLCRRWIVPQAYSLHLVRVVAGSMVIDASGLPVRDGGTLGTFEAVVLGGRLEIVVPSGVEVKNSIRGWIGGRVDVADDPRHGGAHILLRGTIALGRLRVRCVEQ